MEDEFFFASSEFVKFYDQMAELVEPAGARMHSTLRAFAAQSLGAETRYVVDLGVGTGVDIEVLCGSTGAVTYVGIDSSRAALTHASARAQSLGLEGRFIPLHMDIRGLTPGLLHEEVARRGGEKCGKTVVFSSMTLHHMTLSERRSIYQVCRMLCGDSGAFLNSDLYSMGDDVLDQLEVEKHLAGIRTRAAGFRERSAMQQSEEFSLLVERWCNHYLMHSNLVTCCTDLKLLEEAGFSKTGSHKYDNQRALVFAKASK